MPSDAAKRRKEERAAKRAAKPAPTARTSEVMGRLRGAAAGADRAEQ